MPSSSQPPVKRSREGLPVIPSLLSLPPPSWTLSKAPVPRFFIIRQAGEGSFHTSSPFWIHRAIQSAINEPKKITKLRNGELLIETTGEYQTAALQSLTTLQSKGKAVDVLVTVHPHLNHSQGIIYCTDFNHVPLEEISEETKDQGVISITRLLSRSTKQSHLYKLTFNSPQTPTTLTAGYLKLPVRPYIPPPYRCHQCLRFGHGKEKCRSVATCKLCGGSQGDVHICTSPKCINCSGPHSSWSKLCPRYKLEVAIQEIRCQEKISMHDARKIYHQRNPFSSPPKPQDYNKDFPPLKTPLHNSPDLETIITPPVTTANLPATLNSPQITLPPGQEDQTTPGFSLDSREVIISTPPSLKELRESVAGLISNKATDSSPTFPPPPPSPSEPSILNHQTTSIPTLLHDIDNGNPMEC